MFRGDNQHNNRERHQGKQEWKKKEFKSNVISANVMDIKKKNAELSNGSRRTRIFNEEIRQPILQERRQRLLNSGRRETIRPMVRLKFDELPETGFLIDTGSEITIVNEKNLDKNKIYGKEPGLEMIGVNNMRKTLYSINVTFQNKNMKYK